MVRPAYTERSLVEILLSDGEADLAVAEADGFMLGDPKPVANGEVEVAKRKDGSWLLDGMISVEELAARLELEPVAAEERGLSHTLGGLVMTQLGRIPAAGDRIPRAPPSGYNT